MSTVNRTSTIKPGWIDWVRTEPAATAALAVFALAGATLAGAWYFQLVVGLPPCPLCLQERIPYHVVIPLSLLMAIAAVVRAPAKLLTVGFIAIMVAMLCNAVIGSYHAGVEWHLWAGPADCTGPLTDFNTGGSLLDQLHSVKIVRCDEAAWRFLGISLAGYNVLISLVLAAIAGIGLLAHKPAA
jgi:disulfide bond formation protein DsbB